MYVQYINIYVNNLFFSVYFKLASIIITFLELRTEKELKENINLLVGGYGGILNIYEYDENEDDVGVGFLGGWLK